ncbi:MAG: hypothetical protein A3G81_05280 [Betaproteobacteria bacterium RIFCSPLOWO2_12_FULL_65_14]|nr:MAG: hypothetical protein A3G81_05280 [Betaproteobacteria bacterium RIFCSPLOWO2_12_FULL_65_14]
MKNDENAWRSADGKPIEAITDTSLIGFEERGLFYVNSGQSLGRGQPVSPKVAKRGYVPTRVNTWVSDAFPSATFKGNIPVTLIEKELGGTVLLTVRGSGDYVVSRVAIRQVAEANIPKPKPKRQAKLDSFKRKATQATALKRKANRVLEKLPLQQWRGVVDYISTAELNRGIMERPERIRAEQVQRAKSARSKRRPRAG